MAAPCTLVVHEGVWLAWRNTASESVPPSIARRVDLRLHWIQACQACICILYYKTLDNARYTWIDYSMCTSTLQTLHVHLHSTCTSGCVGNSGKTSKLDFSMLKPQNVCSQFNITTNKPAGILDHHRLTFNGQNSIGQSIAWDPPNNQFHRHPTFEATVLQHLLKFFELPAASIANLFCHVSSCFIMARVCHFLFQAVLEHNGSL